MRCPLSELESPVAHPPRRFVLLCILTAGLGRRTLPTCALAMPHLPRVAARAARLLRARARAFLRPPPMRCALRSSPASPPCVVAPTVTSDLPWNFFSSRARLVGTMTPLHGPCRLSRRCPQSARSHVRARRASASPPPACGVPGLEALEAQLASQNGLIRDLLARIDRLENPKPCIDLACGVVTRS